MPIQTTEYKRCAVVKMTGRIDTQNAARLEESFNSVLKEQGKSNIVFDMSEIEFIASRGIWVLLETQKACKRDNGEMVLASVNEDINKSLDLAGVNHFIHSFEDVLSAVANF